MRRVKLYMAVVSEVDGKYYPHMLFADDYNPAGLYEEIVRRNIKESFIFLTKIAAAAKVEELQKEYEDKELLAVGANIL